MGHPLDDICIYYRGSVIKTPPEDLSFSFKANYIADFYHQMLFGYKPPKTARICISIFKEKPDLKPSYNGSICHTYEVIDEEQYLAFKEKDQLKYLLDLVHNSCIELTQIFQWDISVFERAYQEIISRDFIFSISYPAKKSRNKKVQAQVIVDKTPETSSLSLKIINQDRGQKILLFNKENCYWYDIIYDLAKEAKWKDNDSFGIFTKKLSYYKQTKQLYAAEDTYYAIQSNSIVGKIEFRTRADVLRLAKQ